MHIIKIQWKIISSEALSELILTVAIIFCLTRAELPVVPTISARLSVDSFDVYPLGAGAPPQLDAALFEVPPDYREDLHWFPDL